jgi:soluble lytic murein transglycosylase
MMEKRKISDKKNIFFRRYIIFLAILAVLILFLPFAGDVREYLIDDSQFSEIIELNSKRYNLDKELIRAVIFVESKFNIKSRGKAGEIGLMQIIPQASVTDWARVHKRKIPSNYELFDPELNIAIGSWYLKKVMAKYGNDPERIELALCAYNAGARNADKYWKLSRKNKKSVIDNIEISSTKAYVKKIMKRYHKYKKEANN